MDNAAGHPVRVLLVEEDSERVNAVLGVLEGDARFAVHVVPASMLRLRKVVGGGHDEVDLLLVGLEGVDSLTLGLYRAAFPNSRTIGYAAPDWSGRDNLASIGIRTILDWPLARDTLWTTWSTRRTVPGVGRMDQALARLQAQSSQIAQHLKRLQSGATGSLRAAPDPADAPTLVRQEDGAADVAAQQVVSAPLPTQPALPSGARAPSAPQPADPLAASESLQLAPSSPAPGAPHVLASPAPAEGAGPATVPSAPYEQGAASLPEVAPRALSGEEGEELDPRILDHSYRQPNLIPSLLQRRERQPSPFSSSGDIVPASEEDALYPEEESPFAHAGPPMPPGRRDWAPGDPNAPIAQPPVYDYAYQNVEAARAAARAAEQAMLIAKQAVDVVQGAMANPAVRARVEAGADEAAAPSVPRSYFRPPRPVIPVRRSDPDQGLVLGVYSPKGGTGCSTLAVNLAVSLCQTGVSVALVDGHRCFGSVDVLLQLDPQGPSMLSFVDEPDIQPNHVLEALTPHASGVRTLLAPPQPEQGERVTSEIYQHVLNQLCRHFICTIIDLPADYDPSTAAIIQRADRLLVASGPDLAATRALGRFLSYAEELPGVLERTDLVLIRADSVPPEQVAYLEEQLGAQFTHRVLSDGRRTTQAANRGMPFVLSAPDAPVSKDIRFIAHWLTRTYLESRARILWMDQEARFGGRR